MGFRLKKVRIENFATVRSSEIEFPDKGMVLVRGINDCSHGKLDSSGAGKTALGEALSRTCFGVLGRYTKYGHFSNDHTGNKNTLVQVDGVLDEVEFSVKSGFRHPDLSTTGEGLAYRLGGGEWIQRGHLVQTRAELSRALGVTPQVASWTVYVDGDSLKFNNLSHTELVDLVLASLNQPPWTEYADKARTFYLKAKGGADIMESQAETAKIALQEASEAVEEAKARLSRDKKTFDEAQAVADKKSKGIRRKIVDLETQEAEIEEKKKKIRVNIKNQEEESASAYAKFETRKLGLKTRIEAKRREVTKATENKSDARSDLRKLQATLEEMESIPENCPTCHQKWDRVHEKKEIGKTKSLLKEAEALFERRNSELKEVETQLDDLEAQAESLDGQMSEQRKKGTEALSEQFAECDRDLKNIREERDELKDELTNLRTADDTALRRSEVLVDEALKRIVDRQSRLDVLTQKAAETRKSAAVSNYLRVAFGPTGIPNMVLQESIFPLNEASRIVSSRMTGNSITVKYSTTKELASGDSRAELVVKSENKFGGKRVEGGSKGESGLTNLIVSETISEMSNISARVAFRWYDEVLRNPDETMRRNFFSYVADVAKKKNMLCFVVDHGPEAANYADHVLVAHKTDKGTRYYWD